MTEKDLMLMFTMSVPAIIGLIVVLFNKNKETDDRK